MFGKAVVRDFINRSAENETDRRVFLKAAGVAGLGTLGAGALGTALAGPASADETSDAAILNFALNLEYLEAEFYLNAVTGRGLPPELVGGTGTPGGVVGGRKVRFKSKKMRQVAKEIAQDELAHVKFLRGALGGAAVSRPAIDIKSSFTAAARAAGLIGRKQTFNPYANENNFLLAAFIFEDIGVTAYKGGAPLITNKAYVEAAAGILSVEAYHAGIIRLSLFDRDLNAAANKISAARDSLDGASDDDQGTRVRRRANLVPTDANGITYSRSVGNVHNLAYLTPDKATSGGFFPAGTNNPIGGPAFTTSNQNR